MTQLTLRIAEDGTELPLQEGSQVLVRDANGLHVTGGDAANDAVVRLRIDRRGAWLWVVEGTGGVHVNGRRIRQKAMLRAGDAIFLDGTELVLASAHDNPLPDDLLAGDADGQLGDPRVVLRGVGGKHHGRAFTLERPRLVGSAAEADIRIDDPTFAERHALLSLVDGQVVLRDLGAGEGSQVNGRPLRDAVLRPGDQLVFDAQYRFVVEAPGAVTKPMEALAPLGEGEDGAGLESRRTGGWRRWPWLLLAAVLTSGVLAALLMFGAPR